MHPLEEPLMHDINDLKPQLIEVTNRRLASLPPTVRGEFAGKQTYVSPETITVTDAYILVSTYNRMRLNQIKKRIRMVGEAFPGLVTTRRNGFQVALTINRTQRLFFDLNIIEDYDFCFFIGQDSTIIIEDLK